MKLDSEEAYDKLISYTFIQWTDHSWKGKLEEDLANQFALGVNSYPCDLTNATNMNINYKNLVNNPNRSIKKNQQPKKDLEK